MRKSIILSAVIVLATAGVFTASNEKNSSSSGNTSEFSLIENAAIASASSESSGTCCPRAGFTCSIGIFTYHNNEYQNNGQDCK